MEDFGDINGDGAVNTDDLLATAGIFLGSAPENPAEGTDFDCNGIVTVADYCRLKNYLLEKQVPSVRYNWDISVSGNGFLQLMDADGKTIYAESAFVKAEADGSLTDENGNCLLGVSGDTSAEPGSGKIKISVPYLEPAKAEATETFNGTEYTLTAEKCTSKGNVFFDFTDSYSLPEGTKAVADITGGCIKITLNSEEYFKNTEELTDCINSAITEALDGEEHPAGRFTLTASDESEFESSESGLSGSEITGSVSVLGIKSFELCG